MAAQTEIVLYLTQKHRADVDATLREINQTPIATVDNPAHNTQVWLTQDVYEQLLARIGDNLKETGGGITIDPLACQDSATCSKCNRHIRANQRMFRCQCGEQCRSI